MLATQVRTMTDDDKLKFMIQDAVKEVVKSELKPVNETLTSIQGEMGSVCVRLDAIEDRMTTLEQVTDRSELWEHDSLSVPQVHCRHVEWWQRGIA